MDVALLKTFLEVARTRHFGKAAEALYVTQSAVSARIKLLESNLGVELFTRRRNDIQLTPAGNRLRKHAETIVRGWERARLDVASDSEFGGALAVGCQRDLWNILVLRWVADMRRRTPEAVLNVDILAPDVLVQRLVSGVLDLAFLFEPPQISDLDIRSVAEIPLILVADRPDLDLSEALGQDYLMVDWGGAFAQSFAEHFPDMPLPRIRLGSGSLALDLLLATGGAAFLAEEMVRHQLEEGRLFRVKEAPVITRQAFVVFRPGEGSRRGLLETALKMLVPAAGPDGQS